MPLSSAEHQRVSRETKANRNFGRLVSRAQRRMCVYRMVPIDPAVPEVVGRWAVQDPRFSRPETVKQVATDTYACSCGEWWRTNTDCVHIRSLREELDKLPFQGGADA